MHVAPRVEMLELPATLMSGPGMLYPSLIWDEEKAFLVDAGLPGMTPLFLEAIGRAGVAPEKLTGIIITHHDLDHIGSLGELQRALPRPVEIFSHPEEVPFIQGELPPIKMTPKMMEQMGEQLKSMPEEQRRGMQQMIESLKKQKITVGRTVADGDVLPYCGGIQIIHTPGHTPGHICLYLQDSKTLIAGDALFVEEGKLMPAPAFINADSPMALRSLKKLTNYNVDNVIAYHGGLYREDPNKRIYEISS